MRATLLLQRQHASIRQLTEVMDRGSRSVRESLITQLATDLIAHIQIEDEVFYPRIKALVSDKIWLDEHFHDHAAARASLQRLLDMPASGEEFDARLNELRTCLDEHIREEEETLFPEVERLLGNEAARALGLEMMKAHTRMLEAGIAPERESELDRDRDRPPVARAMARPMPQALPVRNPA